jgi:hypothetical protein
VHGLCDSRAVWQLKQIARARASQLFAARLRDCGKLAAVLFGASVVKETLTEKSQKGRQKIPGAAAGKPR